MFSDVPSYTSLVEHDVKLLPGATPVKQPPYRMSPVKFEILSKEIKFLLDNDIIEPGTSEWASPCLLVPKSDGSWRLCTDYRKVNTLTVSDCFPLPRIDDIIDKVGSSKFISRIDLLIGYQVPLTDNAKRISALITPTGLYQYKTMPFGMKGTPATFQRLITNILSGLERVVAYLDDLIIFTDSWRDHIGVLNQVFQRLRQAKLTVNLLKSEFGHAKLKVLGHEVGSGCVFPVSAKIDAIQSLPIPKNRKAVQTFLGMTGYYRQYCPNYADVAKPLTDLISPKKKIV